jgi:hypothetical protein
MRAKSPRFSFLLKIGVAIVLVVAFDWLFPQSVEGACVGLFALAWLLGVILARPALRHPRLAAATAIALAAIFCVALVYDPGPLAVLLFLCALSIATLLPRTARFDDAWRWAIRLLLHGMTGAVGPIRDLLRLLAVRPRGKRQTLKSLGGMLALPLLGTAIFTALFASANPVIADALSRLQLPSLGKVIEWTFATFLVWPMLRPHRIVTRLAIPDPVVNLPGTSLASALIALTLFNALFAIENGLDIAFLWSNAPLPAGTSMADYAHKGAYPLIATALLAGLLVLTMLRPGTVSAANPWARRLVFLWVAQNIFLVASSALRTIDYIEAYDLTAWRIAALAWMALVAIGLMLICCRIWTARSTRWLINANALAATLVLVPCCFIGLGATAARWNVDHAREVGGKGSALDLCYLHRMGEPALLPLIDLERRLLPPELADRVHHVRGILFERLADRQAHWWSWTPHGEIRLARAQALLGPNPPRGAILAAGDTRQCDGSILHPEAPVLTRTPAQ